MDSLKNSDIVGTIDQLTLDKNNGVYKIDKIGKYIVIEDLVGPLIIGGEDGDMNGVVIDFGNHSISTPTTKQK